MTELATALAIVGLYLVMVTVGPKIMSGLSPIDSYPVRFVYNVVQVRQQLPYTLTKPRSFVSPPYFSLRCTRSIDSSLPNNGMYPLITTLQLESKRVTCRYLIIHDLGFVRHHRSYTAQHFFVCFSTSRIPFEHKPTIVVLQLPAVYFPATTTDASLLHTTAVVADSSRVFSFV